MYCRQVLLLMVLVIVGHKKSDAEAQHGEFGAHMKILKPRNTPTSPSSVNWSMMKLGDPETETHGTTLSCYREGLYSHPYDCKRFYRCVDIFGNNDLMSLGFACKPGHYFSPEHRSCVAGTCNSGVVSAIAIAMDHHSTTLGTLNHNYQDTSADLSLTSLEQSPLCLTEGRIADPDDCGQYYECVHDRKGDLIANKQSCFGLAFNAMLGYCVPIEMVKGCYPGVSGEFRNINTEDPILQKVCTETPNAFLCLNCKQLLLCADTQPHLMPCKFGHICNNNTESFIGGVCYPTEDDQCSCNNDDTFQPDIYDPTKFLSCGSKGADPVVDSCPDGLEFNREYNSCGMPVNTTCSESGTFAISNDCTMYHTCKYTPIGWFQNVFKCSNNTMYNEQTGKCEDPCGWYNGNYICEEEGRFPNPEDCSSFYECIPEPLGSEKFIKIKHSCPEGFNWQVLTNKSHCAKRDSTKEKCEPQKPNKCKIPYSWCTSTKATCALTSCGINMKCEDNGGTSPAVCSCIENHIPEGDGCAFPTGFELYNGRVVRRTLSSDPLFNYDGAMGFCSQFESVPFLPQSEADHQLYREVRAPLGVGGNQWLPVNDIQQEGNIRWYNGQPATGLSMWDWLYDQVLAKNIDDYDCFWYGHSDRPRVYFMNCDTESYPPICEKV